MPVTLLDYMKRTILSYLVLLVVGCTQDFDIFTPVPDIANVPTEAGDATSVSDASASDAGADIAVGDAGCGPQASCLSTATSCGQFCRDQQQQCASKCDGGNGNTCPNKCRSDERLCIDGCAVACVNCTRIAGCMARSACDAATN